MFEFARLPIAGIITRLVPVKHPRPNCAQALLLMCFLLGSPAVAAKADGAPSLVQRLITEYCADCHDAEMKKGGLDLASISSLAVDTHPEIWEKAVRRLQARQMPPAEKKRPDESTYQEILSELERSLDAAAERCPNPARRRCGG